MSESSSLSKIMPKTLRPRNSYRGFQRVTLIAWVIALTVAAVIMAAALFLLALTPPPPLKAPERKLPAMDAPLLTPEAKAEARETGFACYKLNGVYYVNASLPVIYWLP